MHFGFDCNFDCNQMFVIFCVLFSFIFIFHFNWKHISFHFVVCSVLSPYFSIFSICSQRLHSEYLKKKKKCEMYKYFINRNEFHEWATKGQQREKWREPRAEWMQKMVMWKFQFSGLRFIRPKTYFYSFSLEFISFLRGFFVYFFNWAQNSTSLPFSFILCILKSKAYVSM